MRALRAVAAEQAADPGGVPFGARGGLQRQRLVQVADRLVLRAFPEQPAGILERRRADQRPRVAAVRLDGGQGQFEIIVEKARACRAAARSPGKPGFPAASRSPAAR